VEAQVTIKLTPAEFDLMREALVNEKSRVHEITLDASEDVRERSAAKGRFVRLGDILDKLR